MKNNKAISMVELLVSIVVASILVLTIGVLSDIGNTEHKKARNTQSLYNDVSYALKLIRNRVRDSESMVVNATSNPPWAGSPKTNPPFILSAGTSPWQGGRLLVRHLQGATTVEGAFCMYQVNAKSPKELVYILNTAIATDCDAGTNCEKIFSVPAGESLNLTFAKPPENTPTTVSTSVPINSVLVRVEGQKNKISFDIKNVVLRRTP